MLLGGVLSVIDHGFAVLKAGELCADHYFLWRAYLNPEDIVAELALFIFSVYFLEHDARCYLNVDVLVYFFDLVIQCIDLLLVCVEHAFLYSLWLISVITHLLLHNHIRI